MASSHLTHSGSSSFYAGKTNVEQSTGGEEEQIAGYNIIAEKSGTAESN